MDQPRLGVPMIPGRASGPVVFHQVDAHLSSTTGRPVVYADDLGIEVARCAVQYDAVAVVTEGGAASSHGAILLRAAQEDGRRIVWIRGVSRDQMRECGDWVTIVESGLLTRSSDARARPGIGTTVDGLDEVSRTKDGISWTCLAPQKSYETLAGSLIAGLLARPLARWLPDAEQVRGEITDGRMWFANAGGLHDVLWQAALDPVSCSAYLTAQEDCYASLHSSLGTVKAARRTLDAHVDLLATFFDASVLFHWNYERYISYALTHGARSAQSAERIRQSFSEPAIVSWLGTVNPSLTTRKSLCAGQVPIPLPTPDLREDVRTAVDRAVTLAVPHWDGEDGQLARLLRMVALKEWKFGLVKVLLSRVARCLDDAGLVLLSDSSDRTNLTWPEICKLLP